ncbi:MAG: capsid assembly scaffolding protein Gp46 family protein [Anaerovoracaceae bacterium]|jgi:hypothetical protein
MHKNKLISRFAPMMAPDGDAGGGQTGDAPDAANEQQQETEHGKDDKEAPKYTDKDVDEIVNRKRAKWQEQQQKAVDEAKKLAQMDAQQKAEYERDQLQSLINYHGK